MSDPNSTPVVPAKARALPPQSWDHAKPPTQQPQAPSPGRMRDEQTSQKVRAIINAHPLTKPSTPEK